MTHRHKVLHKQIYRPTPFGSGQVNTTLCGRVRNGGDYNVADDDHGVTCKFCRRLMPEELGSNSNVKIKVGDKIYGSCLPDDFQGAEVVWVSKP